MEMLRRTSEIIFSNCCERLHYSTFFSCILFALELSAYVSRRKHLSSVFSSSHFFNKWFVCEQSRFCDCRSVTQLYATTQKHPTFVSVCSATCITARWRFSTVPSIFSSIMHMRKSGLALFYFGRLYPRASIYCTRLSFTSRELISSMSNRPYLNR